MAKAKEVKDVTIERSGTVITLPPSMTFDDGIVWLQRMRDAAEAVVRVHETIEGAYLLDAAHAFAVAVKERYGFTAQPGGGDQITVEAAPGISIPVPWGRFTVPTFKPNSSGGSWLATGMHVHPETGATQLQIIGNVRGEDANKVRELAADTRRILATGGSIYKGKALRVTFPAQPDPSHGPRFLPLSGMRPEDLIFSRDVRQRIEASIFTPLTRTEECRVAGIPLRRGVLLAGPYGTGKTMTATVAAGLAVANGWTFLYLDRVADLARAIVVARQYQPCVVFAEDIDREVAGERTASMDAILNTIDGIDGKRDEVMVILTTNHVDRIAQAMLRPGRLDDVITVNPPDAPAAAALVRMYGRDLIPDTADLSSVGARLAGQIPAIIRETVERAKLSALARGEPGVTLHLAPADLIAAADGMLTQLRLLAPKPEDNRPAIERLGSVLGSYVHAGIVDAVNGRGALVHAGTDHPLTIDDPIDPDWDRYGWTSNDGDDVDAVAIPLVPGPRDAA